MGWWQRLFGGKAEDDAPFMEHPSGEFDSAVAAIEDAVRRLHALPHWEGWITFSAQGCGADLESYEFAEVRLLGHKLDVGPKSLDVQHIVRAAAIGTDSLTAEGNYYSLGEATPGEVARLLDAIFRHHFGIKPFAEEGGDYACGAEW